MIPNPIRKVLFFILMIFLLNLPGNGKLLASSDVAGFSPLFPINIGNSTFTFVAVDNIRRRLFL